MAPVKGTNPTAGSEPLAGSTVGQRIRSAYLRAGFNRSSFARAIDKSYGTVIAWENGKSFPRRTSLELIAEVTGFPYEAFISGPSPSQSAAAEHALNSFIADTPAGKMATPEEIAQMRRMHFGSKTPTAKTYEYLLIALREALDPDDAMRAAEYTASVAERKQKPRKKLAKKPPQHH